ncbi:hypothetical protein KFL_000720010 [Klebsormidium nitens]|uniref:Uncharacterized protein n=1 Tax=Klebsormidium nitens TaxID=105231 RepID=A0A1Y1HTG5_KLENI|nr:hypothetical protein KFL_000720010 [Klebsormidium nitens]|eukprot:GAQ81132.1 hypothetical protein KFL_000720010 [Klebsormidium nitens]
MEEEPHQSLRTGKLWDPTAAANAPVASPQDPNEHPQIPFKYASQLLADQANKVRRLALVLKKQLAKDYDNIKKVVVTVHTALSLPVGDSKRFGNRPMYARATKDFHKRPWFSNVAVQGEDPGQPPVDLYARVRMFLSFWAVNPETRARTRREVALMRYYKELGSRDVTN